MGTDYLSTNGREIDANEFVCELTRILHEMFFGICYNKKACSGLHAFLMWDGLLGDCLTSYVL